jgi:hypothetical protein
LVVEPVLAKDGLRFLTPTQTLVGGSSCEDMLVCGATKILGRLQGFLVDPVAHRLRYLVVQTTDLFRKSSLMPITEARIDMGARAIQLLNQDDIQHSEPFSREHFALFGDDRLVTT